MDVRAWLEDHGLGQYAEAFASNDVDAEVLRTLTADDLKELGVASLGHRKKLLAAVADLDAAGKGEPAPSLEARMPRHLAERVLRSRAALEGERKQVTVLFADVKGSLALIEHADPEDARRILDAALGVMMDGVHRYEGTVNRVLGDGIMALFGAPIAHEDHAVRACYAALAIQRAMHIQAAELRGARGVEVSARIGLHSGEVLVRAIGNDLSMDYDAIGPTVHLASRMEQLASPGTIRLTAATAGLAEGFVDLRTLGQVPVKGLSQPVEAFDLVGVGAARTRLQAAAGRGLTPFVGRKDELAALDRARELAAAGQGQIVALVGEPGVGKSRLFYELTHGARMRPWLVVEGTSVSSGSASSWAPVVDLLKPYFGIAPGDDRRAQRREGAGQGPAAGRDAAGRSCRRCSPCSICRSRTPPGRRSIRPSGAGALWTASRRCSCAKASGSRSPWSSRTCTGSTARPRRCSTAWWRACPPVASCCSSTTARSIGTAGAAGRITRSCASTRSRRQAPRSCFRDCSAMRRISRS